MSEQPTNSEQPKPTKDQPASAAEVDLEALTEAVERLWRRDLAIERERLNGGARPDQHW